MSKKSTIIICQNCKKSHLVKNRHSSFLKYCSADCQRDFAFKQRYQTFLDGKCTKITAKLKNKIIETQNNACAMCNIAEWLGEPIMLILDHIDGNHENNTPSNIRCICSNCDATLPTYKSKNNGNGRHIRRIRYKENKSY